jgi:hypothetical protein
VVTEKGPISHQQYFSHFPASPDNRTTPGPIDRTTKPSGHTSFSKPGAKRRPSCKTTFLLVFNQKYRKPKIKSPATRVAGHVMSKVEIQ